MKTTVRYIKIGDQLICIKLIKNDQDHWTSFFNDLSGRPASADGSSLDEVIYNSKLLMVGE